MNTFTLNGRDREVAEGETILQAARRVGVEIPTLCHHADLSPVGSCRLCFCHFVASSGNTSIIIVNNCFVVPLLSLVVFASNDCTA